MNPVLFQTLFGGSDFSPLQISGIQLWMDAGTIDQADGTPVATWKDKVSGTNMFSMSTTAAQPILKTNVLNGKPVIRFDGIDDNLTICAPLSANILGSVNGISYSSDSSYMAVALSVSPYVQIYKRAGNYFELLPNPVTLPPAIARDCKFSPNGNYLTVTHSSTPFITIYKRSGDTFTKLSNPATLPTSTSYGVAWSHDSSLMAVAHLGSPYVTIYSVNSSTDTFTKEPNPTDLPTGQCNGVAFDSTKTYLALAVNTSPYVLIYKITSGPTFTKLTDPTSLPTGSSNDVSFSPDGNYLAFAHGASPYVTVYSRSGDSFTKISNPASLPGGNGNGVAWSTSSDYLSVSHSLGALSIYNMSGGTLTKISTISAQPIGTTGTRCAYSPDGTLFSTGTSTAPFLNVYSKSGDTFTSLSKLDMLRNVGGATIFVVGKYAANGLQQMSFSATKGATTGGRASLYSSATSNLYTSSGRRLDSDASVSVSSTTTVGNYAIHAANYNYATSDLYQYINGVIEGSTTTFQTDGNTSNTDSVAIRIGAENPTASSFLSGDVAEVIVYNRALTSGEIAQVNAYLTVKYFLTDPTKISGLMAWYDASTLIGTSGTAVTALLDKSGNEAHMYQSTTAAQPTLQTGVINGKNVVRFDGIDDSMNLTAPFDVQPSAVAGLNAVSWSNTGNYVIQSMGSGASPYHILYKVNGNVFTKMADLTSLTGVTSIQGTAWSNDDTYLAVATTSGSRIYFFKRVGDTFTKLADPSTLPNSTCYGVDFFWDGNNHYVAVSGGGDKLFLYKNNGDVFNPLTAPATLPTGTQSSYCKFSPNGNYLYVSANGAPSYITFYQRVGDTFTKLDDPSTALTTAALSATWIDEQNVVVAGTSVVPRLYTWDGTTFQQGNQVGTYSAATNIEFDSTKTYLVLATGSSPFIRIYKRSGSTYTQLSTPASIPTSTGRGVSWSPNGSYIAIAHTSAPFIQIYRRTGDTFTNLTKLNMLRNVSGATLVAVKKNTNYTNTAGYLSVLNNSTGVRAGFQTGGGATPYNMVGGRRLDTDAFQSLSDTATATTVPQIILATFNYDTAVLNFYVNGALVQTTSTFQTAGITSDTDSTSIRLAYDTVNSFFNGDVADVFILNRVLNATELSNLHQYLGRKWGITIA